MAMASNVRFFGSARIYYRGRNVFLGNHLNAAGVAKALCSTSTGINNTNNISSEGSPDAPGLVTWKSSKAEQILVEKSEKDMPIEMPNPYEREKVCCILCKYNINLNFKNVRLLSQFVSPYTGKLYGRNITRLCRRQQEELEQQIRKSIAAGYMAAKMKSLDFLKDPKLFDPSNPVRPHNY